MRVVPIRCLSDNYAYLIICERTDEAGVVDPSEAEPIFKALEAEGCILTAILNTHHHWDHVGGNHALCSRFDNLRVYGFHSDRGRIPCQTDFLTENDTVPIGLLKGSLTHNPGHTTGAVTYYFGDAAFTGDTMFAGGCGRLFEGTPAQMHDSLCHQIGGHDPQTRIFFGHEYTESNLRFAQMVEPDNPHISLKLERVTQARARGEFTTPSTLAEEFQTNPFMRGQSKTIQAHVRQHDPGNDLDPVSVLRTVRELKDRF